MKTLIHKILAFVQSALSDDTGGGSSNRLLMFIFSLVFIGFITTVVIICVRWTVVLAQLPDWIHTDIRDLIMFFSGATVGKAVVNKFGGNNQPPTQPPA